MSKAIDARSPGISYQALLDTDSHPVPDVLRQQSPAKRKHNELISGSLYLRGIPRTGNGQAVEPGLAVRLPRGAHP